MTWFGSKVKVTILDDATGEFLTVTQMRPADLPESFEPGTTIHLGDENWSVVDAQPKTGDEYAKSKTLTLRLRRIEMMDLNEILFSLPSICDAIPAVHGQPLSGDELLLAEDDWRQFELVSRELAGEVDKEIAKIQLIHENAAAEVGWSEIHVRTKPEIPLVYNLALADLASALGVSAKPAGVTYHDAQSRIADGYSFTRSDGLSVYGVAANGYVQVIGLDQYSDSPPSHKSIDRLKSLANGLKLDLVHWCRCVRSPPDDPLFDSLLSDDSDIMVAADDAAPAAEPKR